MCALYFAAANQQIYELDTRMVAKHRLMDPTSLRNIFMNVYLAQIVAGARS